MRTPRVARALLGLLLTFAIAACGSEPAAAPDASSDAVDDARPAAATTARSERPQPRPAHTRQSQDVGNHPPVVRSLLVRADEDDPALWVADVTSDDPDGDEVTLDVVWIVNGEPAARGERTYDPTSNGRGDRIHVEVTPHDGKVAGATAASGRIRIENSPPTITSTPPASMTAGVYRYIVEATDAERGGPLRYELLQAPDGMRIDPFNGELSWRPGADQAGTHTVEIAVTDSAGARSVQEFALPIIAPGAPPAAPAR